MTAMETSIRKKINDLRQKQVDGVIKGAESHEVTKLHERAVATAKAKFPFGLDLSGLARIDALHRKHCK